MLISRRTLRKDNSSLHLMMMHSTIWKDHVESIYYLEVREHPAWEGGSVETRRLVQSWTSWHVIIKDVTTWKSWSNLGNQQRPSRDRKWMDVELGKSSQGCFEVSKFLIRSLRHDDTVHQEDGGAVRFDDLAELFKWRFAGTSQWSIEDWISFLAKGGGPKKRFQCCFEPYFFQKHFLYFRAIQGHSGGILVDSTLQDSALLPNDFVDYMLMTCSPSRVDWFQEGEVSKGTDSPSFSQPWTWCIPIKIRKKFNTIRINPESRSKKKSGEFFRISSD